MLTLCQLGMVQPCSITGPAASVGLIEIPYINGKILTTMSSVFQVPLIQVTGGTCQPIGAYETKVSTDGGSTFIEWASTSTMFPVNQFTRTFQGGGDPKYYDYSVSIQGTSNSFKFYQRDVANDLSHSFDVKFVPIDILASTTFWDPSHERVSNDFFHLDTHFDDEIPVLAIAARFNLAPLSAFTTILPETQYYNVLNQWVQMPVESWATTVPADSTVQIKMVHSALPGWVKNVAHVLIRVGLNYERPQYVVDKPKETY